jgi:spore germination protein GerM
VNRHLRLASRWLAATMLVTLAACGVENDSAPRKITEANRPNLASTANQNTGSTSGTDRIYLLAPESPTESRHLRTTQRDVGDSPANRLESLFGSLTVVEVGARLRTAIPDGLLLRSAVLQPSGTLVVDVSDQLLAVSSSALIDAVAQIVFTASDVPSVRAVRLLVDGKNRQWPASDGELQTDPLTVYDYPGFIESSQPAFPAVPSPEA